MTDFCQTVLMSRPFRTLEWRVFRFNGIGVVFKQLFPGKPHIEIPWIDKIERDDYQGKRMKFKKNTTILTGLPKLLTGASALD